MSVRSEMSEEMKKKIKMYEEKAIPHLSLDCVIFGYDREQQRLKILLLKLKKQKQWGLPGGYIYFDENMNDAAVRILYERTGAKNIYLKQFKTFGELNRSEQFYKDNPFFSNQWQATRFISIGFFALVNYKEVIPMVDLFSSNCLWHDIDDLPDLMMDHLNIFKTALANLRKDLTMHPVGYNLLPNKFTMSELQSLYEIILGKKLNRGNFYRKITKYQILEKLDEVRKGGAHKSPFLYSFNKERYDEAVRDGLKDIW